MIDCGFIISEGLVNYGVIFVILVFMKGNFSF